ncbi:MAG: sugar ABC transporter permease, partial [Candidatus Latescibacteria bacterium]|nr:sugar ABC transporter permease [Candidatus Latescibacterota bacterium]
MVGFDHYVRALGDPQYLLLFVAGVVLIWAAYRLRAPLASPILAPGSSERRLRPLYVRIAWGAVVLLGLWVGLAQGLSGLVETGDPALYNGFKVTFFYAVGTIPFQLSLATSLAYLLFKITRARGAFRTLFFLPYVTP